MGNQIKQCRWQQAFCVGALRSLDRVQFAVWSFIGFFTLQTMSFFLLSYPTSARAESWQQSYESLGLLFNNDMRFSCGSHIFKIERQLFAGKVLYIKEGLGYKLINEASFHEAGISGFTVRHDNSFSRNFFEDFFHEETEAYMPECAIDRVSGKDVSYVCPKVVEQQRDVRADVSIDFLEGRMSYVNAEPVKLDLEYIFENPEYLGGPFIFFTSECKYANLLTQNNWDSSYTRSCWGKSLAFLEGYGFANNETYKQLDQMVSALDACEKRRLSGEHVFQCDAYREQTRILEDQVKNLIKLHNQRVLSEVSGVKHTVTFNARTFTWKKMCWSID